MESVSFHLKYWLKQTYPIVCIIVHASMTHTVTTLVTTMHSAQRC